MTSPPTAFAPCALAKRTTSASSGLSDVIGFFSSAREAFRGGSISVQEEVVVAPGSQSEPRRSRGSSGVEGMGPENELGSEKGRIVDWFVRTFRRTIQHGKGPKMTRKVRPVGSMES